MAVINIYNNASDESTIDIFGDIGEDWFSEGNTIQSVNNQIKNITSGTIRVNIGSLGGDVVQGFGIYNILRQHKARIITDIVQPTASAGTLIAQAGDERNMSEASLFLAHNVWTMSVGNAEDLRSTAEDLDQFDERLVDVYQKTTGLPKNQLRKLMAEERWLDAKEAKEKGFIHNIIKDDVKIAAKIITDIKNCEKFPKLPVNIKNNKNMDNENKQALENNTNAFTKLNNWLEKQFSNEDTTDVVEEKVEKPIENKGLEELSGHMATLAASVSSLIETTNANNEAHEARLKAVEDSIQALGEETKTTEAKIEEKEAALNSATEVKNKLEAEIAKLRGVEVKPQAKSEEPIEEKKIVNSAAGDSFFGKFTNSTKGKNALTSLSNKYKKN